MKNRSFVFLCALFSFVPLFTPLRSLADTDAVITATGQDDPYTFVTGAQLDTRLRLNSTCWLIRQSQRAQKLLSIGSDGAVDVYSQMPAHTAATRLYPPQTLSAAHNVAHVATGSIAFATRNLGTNSTLPVQTNLQIRASNGRVLLEIVRNEWSPPDGPAGIPLPRARIWNLTQMSDADISCAATSLGEPRFITSDELHSLLLTRFSDNTELMRHIHQQDATFAISHPASLREMNDQGKLHMLIHMGPFPDFTWDLDLDVFTHEIQNLTYGSDGEYM